MNVNNNISSVGLSLYDMHHLLYEILPASFVHARILSARGEEQKQARMDDKPLLPISSVPMVDDSPKGLAPREKVW